MKFENPYFGVWLDPRKTLDNIFSGKVAFRYYIPIIMAVTSLSFKMLRNNLLDGYSYDYLSFLISIGVGYLIVGNFYPWLFYKIGRIWKGKGSLKQTQIVVALSQIPVILILIEQVIFFLFGEVKTYESANTVLQWIVWFFYVRALIMGIAHIQKFSYGFALLSLIVSILPFFIIRLLII